MREGRRAAHIAVGLTRGPRDVVVALAGAPGADAGYRDETSEMRLRDHEVMPAPCDEGARFRPIGPRPRSRSITAPVWAASPRLGALGARWADGCLCWSCGPGRLAVGPRGADGDGIGSGTP